MCKMQTVLGGKNMKKILCTLLLLIAIFLASICQASEANQAQYIRDNYCVPAVKILTEDFLHKADNIKNNYPVDAQDMAVADLVLYTIPKVEELSKKLQADKKVKNHRLTPLVQDVINQTEDLLNKFAQLKDKSKLNRKTWEEELKITLTSFIEANKTFQKAYEETQQKNYK